MCEEILNVISAFFGLLSSIYFFLGSKQKPWEIQSWSGNTENELKFYKKQNSNIKIAFILLAFSFLLELISSLLF